jgi:hypothetical protein
LFFLLQDEVYWTDWTIGGVLVANKNNGNGIRVFQPNLPGILDLKVMYPTLQSGKYVAVASSPVVVISAEITTRL